MSVLPIIYNKDTKQLSLDKDAPELVFEEDSLERRINEINRLTKDLIAINKDVPESPEPSAQLTPLIKKLITSGIESLKQKNLPGAIKQLSLAIDMAGKRARWEAFGVQLQELNAILQIRCDAYMMSGRFIDAFNDAEILLNTQVLTADNFLRKGIACINLGRFELAKSELERGLCFHPDNTRIKENLAIAIKAIAIENGDL